MNITIQLMDTFFPPAFQIHGGGGHGIGIVEAIDRLLTVVAEKGVAGVGQALFPGIANMPNVHPLLVHFPIALLTSFFIVELLAVIFRKDTLRAAASWMLYLGTISAVATVATGLLAGATVPHGDAVHDVMESHKNFGLSVVGLSFLLSVWRITVGGRFSAVGQGFHLLLAAVMVALLSFGADLGGMMVYEHGVGVAGVEQPVGHVHDHSGAAAPMLEGEEESAPLPETESGDAAVPEVDREDAHTHDHDHTH